MVFMDDHNPDVNTLIDIATQWTDTCRLIAVVHSELFINELYLLRPIQYLQNYRADSGQQNKHNLWSLRFLHNK